MASPETLGIAGIGVYLPAAGVSNFERMAQFGVDERFVNDKLGVRRTLVKAEEDATSDLAVHAVRALEATSALDLAAVDCLVVVTQNPDYNLPHTAAIVHGKLGLAERCAAFDISMGCSGWVYGLSVVEAFMARNGLRSGLLVTADPYSKIVDPDDKNTVMLFGDAAAATWIHNTARFRSGRFTFGTIGKDYEHLICRNGQLSMNGRGIFDFAARRVPDDIRLLLEMNQVAIDDVDRFLLHQGSRYMLRTIATRLQVDESKAPFLAGEYGNAVSSSIPIMLADLMDDTGMRTLVVSGFGVGLSWSSGLLQRMT